MLTATVLYPTGGKEAIRTAVAILRRQPFRRENRLPITLIDSSNVRIMKLQNEKVIEQQTDIEKQSLRIGELTCTYTSQKNTLYLTLASLMVVMLLGSWALYLYRFKQAAYRTLERQNGEILDQKDKIETVSAQARLATEEKLRFYSYISHEFNTPLSLILTPTEDLLSQKNVSSYGLRSNLLLVQKNAYRLLRLIDQMLDLRNDWNKDFKNPVLNSVTVKPFVGGNQNVPVGDTDWQREVYKTGYVTNNDLTISGGTRSSSLLVNVSYLNNSGMLRYNRLTGRINGLTSKFDGRFKFGVNLQATTSKEMPVASDLGGAPTPGLAITLAPTIPVYTTTGDFGGPLGSGYSDRNNPLAMQYLNRWDKINQTFFFGNVFTEIEPVAGLIFRSSLGMDNSDYSSKNIEQSFQNGFIARSLNSLTLNTTKFLSVAWTNTLRYNFALGGHTFKLLAGVEAIRDNLDNLTAYRENFANQTEDFFVLSAGSGNANSAGTSSGSRLLSQFARIDYGFGDRYLAALTLRRDGSSRFGSDNRYGFFPAASVGWRIDKETFMQGVRGISNLKVRAGVGRIGNQDIGDLARFGLFEARYGTLASQVPSGHNAFFDQYWNVGTAYDLNGAGTGTLPSGFVQTQGQNTALKWETTDELNVGLDFGFLNGRLVGSFDYFTRQTKDILIKPPVASAVGEGQLRFVNGATKTNKGFEWLLTYYGKPKGDFTYNVSANLARFRDKITVLPEEVRSAFAGNAITTIIGRSQLDLFGYRTDGIFQNQAEVDAHAAQVGKAPGRIRYCDLNGDNKIDALDQEFFGTSLPALEYGLRVEMGYKNFDLSLFGSGVAGRTGYDPYTFYNDFIRGRDNVGPGVFNAWTVQNPDATVPALTLSDRNAETRTSDYFNVNTSYFKLRNAQLGYTLDKAFVGRFGLSGLRLYAMGENLFLVKAKGFQGPDPERIDANTIPVPRVLTAGLTVNF